MKKGRKANLKESTTYTWIVQVKHTVHVRGSGGGGGGGGRGGGLVFIKNLAHYSSQFFGGLFIKIRPIIH